MFAWHRWVVTFAAPDVEAQVHLTIWTHVGAGSFRAHLQRTIATHGRLVTAGGPELVLRRLVAGGRLAMEREPHRIAVHEVVIGGNEGELPRIGNARNRHVCVDLPGGVRSRAERGCGADCESAGKHRGDHENERGSAGQAGHGAEDRQTGQVAMKRGWGAALGCGSVRDRSPQRAESVEEGSGARGFAPAGRIRSVTRGHPNGIAPLPRFHPAGADIGSAPS